MISQNVHLYPWGFATFSLCLNTTISGPELPPLSDTELRLSLLLLAPPVPPFSLQPVAPGVHRRGPVAPLRAPRHAPGGPRARLPPPLPAPLPRRPRPRRRRRRPRKGARRRRWRFWLRRRRRGRGGILAGGRGGGAGLSAEPGHHCWGVAPPLPPLRAPRRRGPLLKDHSPARRALAHTRALARLLAWAAPLKSAKSARSSSPF